MSIFDTQALGQIHEAAFDPDEVRRALLLLADPLSGIQLQYKPFSWDSFGSFAGNDLDGMVAWVGRNADKESVYYALNPVAPDLGHSLKVPDVLRRRWILVDVDRKKKQEYSDDSATEAEKEACRIITASIAERMTGEFLWPAPIVIDSGNGWHLLWRLDLSADDDSRILVRRFVHALASRYDTLAVEVDTKVHDARRISKLPGTWARKGPATPDRPHRMAHLISAPAMPEIVSAEMLRAACDALAAPASVSVDVNTPLPSIFQTRAKGDSATLHEAYARAALEREAARVALSSPGGRNDQLFKSAAAIAELVLAGVLGQAEAESVLTLAATRAGLGEREVAATLASAFTPGRVQARDLSGVGVERNGKHEATEPARERNASDVCTIDDLIAAGAAISWLWEGWIPSGVCVAIAAEAGIGKTRFCADLMRRVRKRLSWPDGQAMSLPADALALWVVADNHHDEMVTLCQSFDIAPLVRINAWKNDPFGGVTLETAEDLADLDARIKAVRPAFVIVDTVGNATDRSLSKQEDAKAFYFPLQVLARRHRCAILCLTHLNADGKFLGRRVLEKVRVALQIEKPDPDDDKRRLYVHKSNSRKPDALGLTMGDDGNEYDHDPPKTAQEPGQHPRKDAKIQAAADWLKSYLMGGEQRVSNTRTAAENAGFSAGTLYRAKDSLSVEEFTTQGKKWWRLASDGEVFE